MSWFYSHIMAMGSVERWCNWQTTNIFQSVEASVSKAMDKPKESAIPFSTFTDLIETLKCVCVKHNILLISTPCAIFKNPTRVEWVRQRRERSTELIPYCRLRLGNMKGAPITLFICRNLPFLWLSLLFLWQGQSYIFYIQEIIEFYFESLSAFLINVLSFLWDVIWDGFCKMIKGRSNVFKHNRPKTISSIVKR